MLYAKSEPKPIPETIKEHNDKLLKNLSLLKRLYGKDILKNKNIDKDKFWRLLEIACLYHDIGKVYTPFQNIILEKIGKQKIKTDFNYDIIKHEQLSPLFIPKDKLELTKEEYKLLIQVIYYHHERVLSEVDRESVNKIIEEDILNKIPQIEKEIDVEVRKEPSNFYLKYVGDVKRIREGESLYEQYCLLKGLLHRLDHASSGGVNVEDESDKVLSECTKEFMNDKKFKLNKLQHFCKSNQNENILVIGSTGMGKTEAALLWAEDAKTFFTLPIRISINAIYDRIKYLINYGHVGLLHSTALDYLETKENSEFENSEGTYNQSKNLATKVTTCTIDQIFTFVFKYKGYEKMYSTLSYSKIIIDEIQAYSPSIVAVILKGMQMINNIGGKFMIMTATLPRIYKEELEKMRY